MSDYIINFVRSARKELESLEATVISRIFPKIELLANDPFPLGCRKIQSEKHL